jgi:hypothetical protein
MNQRTILLDLGLIVKCQAENRSKVLKDITLHKK